MFVAGWRHALRSEWPFIIIIIICVLCVSRLCGLNVRVSVSRAEMLVSLLGVATEHLFVVSES